MIAAARDLLTEPAESAMRRAHHGSRGPAPERHLSGAGFACVLVVCGVFAAAGSYPLAHTDLWGHLAYGQWIDEHRVLPTIEPLLDQGRPMPFQPHAWLAQWTAYRWGELTGPAGLITAHAALIALALILLGIALRARGLPPLWIAAGMLAAYVVAEPQWAVIRPQLFGAALFPLILLAVERIKKGPAPVVWLPVVFAVWSQLHGSWLVGWGVLGLMALGASIDAVWRRRSHFEAWREAARLWACAALCLMAVCTNPDGPRGVWDALTLAQNPNLESMREWLPLGLTDGSGWALLATLAITALALRVSPRRWTWAELLPLAALLIATLDTRRMLTWWALLWPWVVLPHLSARWPLAAPSLQRPRRAWTAAALVTALVALSCAPLARVALGPRSADDPRWLSSATPRAAAAALDRLGFAGRLYAPMEWSDYLIWHSRNRSDERSTPLAQRKAWRPLVNSHVHLIDPAVWRDYRAVGRGHASWKSILARHEIEWLALNRQAQPDLLAAVAVDRDFEQVASDTQYVIYHRRPRS